MQAKLVQGHGFRVYGLGFSCAGDGEEEAELKASEAGEPVSHSNGGGEATSAAAGSEGLRHLSAKERRDVKKWVRGA